MCMCVYVFVGLKVEMLMHTANSRHHNAPFSLLMTLRSNAALKSRDQQTEGQQNLMDQDTQPTGVSVDPEASTDHSPVAYIPPRRCHLCQKTRHRQQEWAVT